MLSASGLGITITMSVTKLISTHINKRTEGSGRLGEEEEQVCPLRATLQAGVSYIYIGTLGPC